MVWVIFAVLVVGLVVVLGSSGETKKPVEPPEPEPSRSPVRERKVPENSYEPLRTRAMHMTGGEMGYDRPDGVFGVVMDWNLGTIVITAASYFTGDASVYLSGGQAFIGGRSHESIVQAAKNFVREAQARLPLAQKTDRIEPVRTGGRVGFYLLTPQGRFYLEESMDAIENETAELLDLFLAGDRVVTEYRLLAEKRG